ncbi:MAG: YciI family protein [Ignavibacteria bacterium]|nr:YciI family protein [Ignavibacteria bacterium]
MSKKYMLIFRGGFYDALTPDEAQKQMGKWFSWIEKLQAAGVYHGGEPLTQGGKILSKKGADIVVDGPFVESKESVAGYFLVDAESIDKAADMARDYPDFHLGGKVEVREVMKVEMPA